MTFLQASQIQLASDNSHIVLVLRRKKGRQSKRTYSGQLLTLAVFVTAINT